MNKPKKETAKPESGAPEEKKPKPKKAVKEVTVNVGGAERVGTVVSKRKTNSGDQVCVRLEGFGDRWINTKDIIKDS